MIAPPKGRTVCPTVAAGRYILRGRTGRPRRCVNGHVRGTQRRLCFGLGRCRENTLFHLGLRLGRERVAFRGLGLGHRNGQVRFQVVCGWRNAQHVVQQTVAIVHVCTAFHATHLILGNVWEELEHIWRDMLLGWLGVVKDARELPGIVQGRHAGPGVPACVA